MAVQVDRLMPGPGAVEWIELTSLDNPFYVVPEGKVLVLTALGSTETENNSASIDI